MAENNHEKAATRAKAAAEALRAAGDLFQGPGANMPSREIWKKLQQANHALASAESIFGFDDIVDPPPDLIAQQWRALNKRLTAAAVQLHASNGDLTEQLKRELRRAIQAVASTETIVANDPLFDPADYNKG